MSARTGPFCAAAQDGRSRGECAGQARGAADVPHFRAATAAERERIAMWHAAFAENDEEIAELGYEEWARRTRALREPRPGTQR